MTYFRPGLFFSHWHAGRGRKLLWRRFGGDGGRAPRFPGISTGSRGPGGSDGGGLRGGAGDESRSGGGREGPRVWRHPETSRRRFRRLLSRDVSGPEEALSRRRELCRRWLRPERRSKERMLELLVLEQFLSLLPRRLRDPVRHRRPESGEGRRPGSAPCTRPPRRAPQLSRPRRDLRPRENGSSWPWTPRTVRGKRARRTTGARPCWGQPCHFCEIVLTGEQVCCWEWKLAHLRLLL
ncbi:zinc finger protein 394-like isoform X1 [Meriones unguiculatus]|uniref:zinc finger protein 394-like isoform X1 n=1 Tax=Meriones unguiculatus TaxID=10047 RepID=UPI000B4FD134|nr:zinc finger protein 394-like [Meriones unguiculatus]XP_060232203.1 zinc finger protein 394-like isoform X1 [Meriones unguiculatus]XP_060232204.1 zinc finger protein 394-like isoform X1 [Meriones unguiculatus]XP_060232205.1 zinc finger protein 394-like isoform X1 [Meriones unguiculatus]XP_060232206.1 zinc finger protein 394-like isoform X1 [Meriones unguiculatus]XP_060232207.1 zinc finger protein 394-like isoform X1 [Meriones unguiculatus]